MQKLYVRAKDTEEMLAMLNISKKNSKQNKNYFKLGILLGITIGSIAPALLYFLLHFSKLSYLQNFSF